MKRLLILVITLLLVAVTFTGCVTSRKSQNELRGLMLLDNLQLGRNKAYYSRHNIKMKQDAYRRFKKNNRNL
jgi:hypothetical protein